MSTKLSLDTLGLLRGDIGRPNYPRDALSGGIVHFGVGNFHRAHQAAYLDALFNTGRDLDWALVGAGVVPSDARMREVLRAQDLLTTVVEQSARQSIARVTGSMVEFLPVGDAALLMDALANPAIRIVSLTITEGGYFIDPATGVFDPGQTAIAADGVNPENPGTVFGLIAAALRRRRANGVDAFTVMSCDNVPHNGVITRNAVAGVARLYDGGFADWIETEVAFPNGMVDRITPSTGERERRICAEDFGIEDRWPVFCEDFKQWVLEDLFPSGRPALEDVGVQFVSEVTPYELMKIRILNGGHAAIAYPAGLLDIHFVHEAMNEPLVAGFLETLELNEIIPAVPAVPDTNLFDYYRLAAKRFANPKIGDTVRRLCLDGSNRQPKFIVPTIADRLRKGQPVRGLAFASAMWCRYCFGTTESGAEIEPNDPSWARLQDVARAAKDAPDRWLAMDDIYGEVGRIDSFRREFGRALDAIWSHGVRKAVADHIAGHP